MPDPTTLTHLAALTTGAARPGAGSGGLSVLLEDPHHLDALRRSGVCDTDTVVLTPGPTSPGDADGPVLVSYQGSLAEAGDQLWLDETFVLEVQSYAVSAYLSVHGPTLLRVGGAEDLLALGQDATRSRESGALPRIAASPLVHLADTVALGWPGGARRSRRLVVRADGTLAVSPTGSGLGHVDDLTPTVLDRLLRLDPACALARVVTADDLAGVLHDVPWLPRHLAAMSAIRAVTARGVEVDGVSGLGLRLDPRTPPETGERPADRPVLVVAGEQALVVDPATGRVVPLDLARAAALERHLDAGGDALGATVATALATRGFLVDEQAAA